MIGTMEKKMARSDLNGKIKQLEGINYMIAHNLRGAGANIKMLAEVLMDKKIADDCQHHSNDEVFTISEAIQHIHECAISMLAALNALVEVTDTPAEDKIKYDECDIAEVVTHITDQLSVLLQQKKAAIEFDLAVTHVYYPLPYMESILYNFIHNALKYSRDDVPLKVKISTHTDAGRTVLSVRDNGLGIDLKVFGRRIFNLYQFFHVGYESKGIGLYIIKSQIESLGGSVHVKSEVDEGSEFTVVF